MSLITATLGRIAAPERRTMAVACGWLSVRLGVVRPTFVTEGLTALGILAPATLPLAWRLGPYLHSTTAAA